VRYSGADPHIDVDIRCPACGHYRTPHFTVLKTAFEHADRNLLPYFRAYVRQANLRGEVVNVTADLDWQANALAHTGVPVQRKMTRLLEHIARKGPPGRWHDLPPDGQLAPLLDAFDGVEVDFLISALSQEHLVRLCQIRS
jgi:hypothetical protein